MIPGQMLGYYRILERLGAGGMGVVYKAQDTRLGRTVAIKVLPAEAVADPRRRERFAQEARAASALDHPNIVTIHDIAEADGQHFIVMQYVAGKTLRALLGRGALPLNETLRCAIQIADALAQAHARGIVHRDLKPENVMVNEQGQVKILDFGLAKLAEPQDWDETVTDAAAPSLTLEGSIIGTAAYMSPEQAQGKKVDGRSDIFSFGSLLYEMVTGRQPFRGDNRLAVLSAIVRDEPEDLITLAPSVPAEMARLISRALRKDPERRWQSVNDLRVLLTDIKEESESGQAAAPVAPGERRAPRRWWMAAGALALVLAAGGAVWFRLARPKGESPTAPLQVIPFTSLPGRELDPALSFDGKQVAFAWDGGGGDNLDIYVKLVGAGSPLRLTSNPAPDFGPAWSPDGRHIAFYRGSGSANEVLLVSALGGPERKLGQSAATWLAHGPDVHHRLAWSPDGKSLAIVDKGSPNDPQSIYLLSIETGEKRRLTGPPAEYFGDDFPAFSPGGEKLAFSRWRGVQAGDIHVLSVAEGASRAEPRRLTFDERWILGLDWTPDGRHIVFSSNRAGHTWALWTVPAGAASGRGEPQQLIAGGAGALAPSVSRPQARDGAARLAYAQRIIDTNIWRVAWSGSAAATKGAPLISSTRADVTPQYSPDGNRITFTSNRSGNPEIWVCDSDGSNPVQLTSFGGAFLGSPRWSPDGQRIAFDVFREGHADIYVVSADGGLPRRCTTETSQDVRPSWSSDGRWIYFGSNRSSGWQVWKMPAERGPAVQVTKNSGREAFESPDGKFVYYTKDPDANGIWRVPVGGGDETQVIDRGTQGGWAIAQQGLCILNLGSMPGPVIEFFDSATGRLSEIAALPQGTKVHTVGPYFAVSPDRRWILYTQIDRVESDIMLVENFR